MSRQVTEARRYYLSPAPNPDESFTVVCGGVERCRADYHIRRSRFPFWGLEFVAEGRGWLKLAGREYELRPGTAFAYGAGVTHEIRNDPRRPMLKYYVDFAGPEAASLLRESPLGKWQTVRVSAPNEVVELMESLQRNGESHTPWSPRLCAHLVALLILKITERALSGDPAEQRAFTTYDRVRRHLERHCLELRTLEAAARACHLDTSYLCRLFRRFDHRSPYQFLQRLKMDRAAALLLDSRLMVKEVAAELGFADAFHFSRVFKRVYGLAPEQFVERGGHAEPVKPRRVSGRSR